ncbi:MAG: hypothetical protein V9G16_04745 [Nitrosomonas sp.]
MKQKLIESMMLLYGLFASMARYGVIFFSTILTIPDDSHLQRSATIRQQNGGG